MYITAVILNCYAVLNIITKYQSVYCMSILDFGVFLLKNEMDNLQITDGVTKFLFNRITVVYFTQDVCHNSVEQSFTFVYLISLCCDV